MKYHCINDPTKRHSPALQYRRNPLFVTDDPRAHGKRYRLLSEQERQRFLSERRDDLELLTYSQVLEWLDGKPVKFSAPEEVAEEEDPEEEGVALLELHLQDYIEQNWSRCFPGLTLVPGGREYTTSSPAVGVIDFLAQDVHGNYVVIETKRDRAGRNAVGQLLSYMGWVKRRLCGRGGDVRGVLVVGEVDDALEMQLSQLPNVSVMKYELSFALHPVKTD